jgi:hypothetical protein
VAAAAAAGLVANVIDGPPEVDPSACGTPSVAERVERLKSRLGVLRRRRQSKAVRAEMASAKRELNALVKAPVSGGRDPFEWLPDELIVMIMLMLSFEVLWSSACERVCQRWARLMESAPVKRHKRDGRWPAYEAGVITSRELVGHTHYVIALTVGLNGKVYSGSDNGTILVWSGDDGTHLQSLVGHTDWVCALAVGLDGKVYSGSHDRTIRAWSGDDGTHLQTLVGHTGWVSALAVGLDGNVYSGSWDRTIRVWSGDDGTHLQTLEGHTHIVCALAVGLDGKVYSGSFDKTIRVWSGDDGAHVRTLVGHADSITALAIGSDGNVFSASSSEMRVWSCKDGSLLHTLKGHMCMSMVFGRDGSLFSCSQFATLQVW